MTSANVNKTYMAQTDDACTDRRHIPTVLHTSQSKEEIGYAAEVLYRQQDDASSTFFEEVKLKLQHGKVVLY